MARRVAYYLWRFPILSETFIRRELRAVVRAGIDVIVIADAPGDTSGGDLDPALPADRVRYLHPIDPWRLLRDLLGWLARRPCRTLALLAYTVREPYREPRSLVDDLRVFLKAVHLAAVLRRAGVGHVHSPWGDVNAFVAMVAARLAGLGFSLQFRAHDLHRRTSAFLIAEKIRHARFVVTNTDFNLARLRALADASDRHKIHRIRNGLELAHLPAVARRERARGEAIRLLSVGRLIEPKGLPYLFEACRVLLDRGYPVRCTVIGGPELPRYADDLTEIRAARQRLALEGHVELAGAQPFGAVVEAFRNADIFVLPCVVGRDGSHDITPNALLEAMAVGLPVVSTTITAIPELVEHEVSGLLVPPNDAAALAHALARLIDDPALRARLGAAASARIHERFDIERNIQSYLELFTGP